MKNLFSFLFVVVLLVLSFSFSNQQSKVFSYFKEGSCEFVLSKKAQLSFLPQEATCVLNGNEIIISVKSSLANYVFKNINKKDLKGFVFKFENTFENLKQTLNFKYFKDNQITNCNHYYAFLKGYNQFVFLNGKKVNMHIVEKNNLLVVGFPIILTSY